MFDEKNAQKGAPEIIEAQKKNAEDPSSPGFDAASDGAQRSSVGKIARLPCEIREKVNRRLRDGEPASVILPWLNAEPSVHAVLSAHFDGAAINEMNLSTWRQGGYKRWLEKQELFEDARGTAGDAQEWSAATGAGVARGTARMAVVKIFKLLEGISPERCSAADLVKVSYAITSLLKAEQNQEWLAHDQARVELSGEQLDLRRDIYQRDVVKMVSKALDDELIKRIHGSAYSNAEKFELLGHCLFDSSWRPREGMKAKMEEGARKMAELKLKSEPRPPAGGSPPPPLPASPDEEASANVLKSGPERQTNI